MQAARAGKERGASVLRCMRGTPVPQGARLLEK
jgi:hypothetical protein